MDPPPDYRDVVQERTTPSAPSYNRVFQQTAKQSYTLFGELEVVKENGQHLADYEDEVSMPSRESTRRELRMNLGERFRIGKVNHGREDATASETKGVDTTQRRHKDFDNKNLNSEGQKMFSNRVAFHNNYSEQFINEEDDCTTVFGRKCSQSQAVSIPEKPFVVNFNHCENGFNQAPQGRYICKITSTQDQGFSKANEERQPLESRIITVEPTSPPVQQNSHVSIDCPILSLNTDSSKSLYRETMRKESYVYLGKKDLESQADSERTARKRTTYCFVHMCFCMSCRCALCSTSCRCTWLQCVPCLAYSALCCPFWFVCLCCSFVNPCWREILHVTSGVLKQMASSCESSPGNNCSFTWLADDAEEALWNAKTWGCGIEEREDHG
jgi:hypothetical protein